jgi:hypothetical protein
MTKSAIGLVFLTCVCLPGCGDEDDTTGDATDSLEIKGEWESNFMATEMISDDSWDVESETYSSSSEIVEFSNEDNSVVLLASNGTYGRTVWTDITDGSFYYCGVSYEQASVQDAIDESETPDDSDPATSGCGDFSWNMLTRK